MNGADAFIATLARKGVDTCFANPGTSEMQLVAALDQRDDVRAILGLFEGVVTGAADGYGRMRDRPALTLLHLGPGLANGLANLHNARRARTPVINVVGDHAEAHLPLNAPLTSDVTGVATPMSDWVRRSQSADDLAQAGSEAVAAALRYPGQVATVIAPADHAWTDAAGPAAAIEPLPVATTTDEAIALAADALRSARRPALFLGGRALRAGALSLAARIAGATGARLICETFPARIQRGRGRPVVERLPYFAEAATAALADLDAVVLVGAPAPVSFFAYPGKPSELLPAGIAPIVLADPRVCADDALSRLAAQLSVGEARPVDAAAALPEAPPAADLTPTNAAAIIAELLPEDAIVADEAATSGLPAWLACAGAAPHDWLTLTGGSIGQGLPLALGAAIACPARKVLALQADGGAMYTVQALWSMARERADVTVVLFNNASYGILNLEFARVGAGAPGAVARSMLSLSQPDIDWVSLSRGLGVPAERVDETVGFRAALAEALAADGPRLIEAVVPPPQPA